jgi:hypothetical protein
MAAQSTIEIQRASAYTDRVRAYHVLVDNTDIGTIKNGETKTFDVAPGAHEVKLKIDWAYSPPLTIDAKPGSTVKLAARPKANPFTVLWYTLFARQKYLKLEPVT